MGAEGFEPYSDGSICAAPLSRNAHHQHRYAMRFDAIRTLSMPPLSAFCPLRPALSGGDMKLRTHVSCQQLRVDFRESTLSN